MRIAKILFFLSLTCASLCDEEAPDFGSVVQISKVLTNSNVRKLKANLIHCESKIKCEPRIEIKAWMKSKEEHETFLLIDEVHDSKEMTIFPLLHPYLIQVSAEERTVAYPLTLKQILQVNCSEHELVQHRREAVNEQSVRDADGSEKKENSADDTAAKGNELFLYLTNKNETRKSDSFEETLNNIIASINSEQKNIQIKFNPRFDDRGKPENNLKLNDQPLNVIEPIVADEFNANIKFNGSPMKIGESLINSVSAADFNPFPDAAAHSHEIHQQLIPQPNRFSLNQNENFNEQSFNGLASSRKVKSHSSEQKENLRNSMTDDGSKLQDLIDFQRKFLLKTQTHFKAPTDEKVDDGSDSKGNLFFVNRINQNNQMHLDKSPATADRPNNPIDLFSLGLTKQLNAAHEYEAIASDDETHRYNADGDVSEPVDNEDDPNLFVDGEKFESKLKTREFINRRTLKAFPAAKARFKRRTHINSTSSQTKRSSLSKQNPIKSESFAVYSLSSPPFHQNSTKVQVFLKSQEKWLRLQPEIAITKESENFPTRDFHVSSSTRKSFINSFDPRRTLLLVPENQSTAEGLLTLDNDLIPVSTDDELKQTICSSKSQFKRSLKSLQESGMMPRHGHAIKGCPLNADQDCLNLRDDEASTPWRLEIQLPFLHNEIIDSRTSAVKISNIFIDTSDGSNLLAQFQVTSMDHFTKIFNLTFSRCALLKQLNISHSLVIPPNKSIMVKVSVALPFYSMVKSEKCEVNIIEGERKVVARREFVLNPRGARCVCLWSCACFCFGTFLTVEANDLCRSMSSENEFFAGFYDENDLKAIEDEMDQSMKKQLTLLLPLALICFLLFLGLLKGFLGFCCSPVDSFLFAFVQRSKSYRESSRCRRFLVNASFFFLLPIALCSKCFGYSSTKKCNSEDSIIGRKVVRKEIFSDEDSNDENEESKLLGTFESSSNFSSTFDKFRRSSETIFDVHNNFKSETELENDTRFVVNAMNESHESLCKIESHQSETSIPDDPQFQKAQKFVKELLAARIVYRRFQNPIGSVKVKDNQRFSIRGYFIPAQNSGYQFMTYNPIRQVYDISSNLTLLSLSPQIQLDSKAFRRFYSNKVEVLNANDLSVRPSTSTPCVNVLVQDYSMYDS